MIDRDKFRQVLGQYPTGVCVIAATLSDGEAAGMVVGSFTSVSIDPPLIAFFPDKSSSSWAKLKDCSRFCANILSAEQEAVCRKLASKDPNKFSDISYRSSPLGAPILNGVVAWIDCELHSVADAGDHFVVFGSVQELDVETGALPLLFFQGGYGRFSPLSLVAVNVQGLLTEQLRIIDLARPEMESIASDLSAQCLASTVVDEEVIIAASAGQGRRDALTTLVGQRVPYIPQTGAIFGAWRAAGDIDLWLSANGNLKDREAYHRRLAGVRDRGFSISILDQAQREFAAKLEALAQGAGTEQFGELAELSHRLQYDPEMISEEEWRSVGLITGPVFDASGKVVLALTIHGFPKPGNSVAVSEYADRLLAGTRKLTAMLGGQEPTR